MRRFIAVLVTLAVALSFVAPAAAGNTIRLLLCRPGEEQRSYCIDPRSQRDFHIRHRPVPGRCIRAEREHP